MNGATREQIMDALLAHLQARCTTTFKTYSRQFIDWEALVQLIGTNDPGVPAFPALFLYDGGIQAENWANKGRGTPKVRTMTRHIIIYARKTGAGTPGGPSRMAGGTILHPLIEAVEDALEPGGAVRPDNVVDGVLTLGNKVWWCWLDGTGTLIPGDLDPGGLCMQVMPIKIMIP